MAPKNILECRNPTKLAHSCHHESLPCKNPEGDAVKDYTFTGTGNLCEDIAQVRAQGLKVDNVNEPVPENVPTMNISVDPTTGLFQGQRFHWNGACQ
jgi:hypothetical protein